jgi:hypothetical protein
MGLTLAQAVASPFCFPHRFSCDQNAAELVSTTPDRVRAASFIDGRESFSTGPSTIADLSALIAASSQTHSAAGPERFIFHVAFCGSTLLSRLIDVPGHTLVLREPQCLSDIATWQAKRDREGRNSGEAGAMLSCARTLLRRRWQVNEAIIVKPSNWINNLLPLLCASPADMRPLFLTMDRARFLRAIFRGGSDRVAFAARAAVHLSSEGLENAELVAQALAGGGDQLDALARLGVVLHEMQERMFNGVADKSGWSSAHRLDLNDIIEDPLASARKAARAFGLDLPDAALQSNCDRWSGSHAKQPDMAFSTHAEAAGNASMLNTHGKRIEAALRWAEDIMPLR